MKTDNKFILSIAEKNNVIINTGVLKTSLIKDNKEIKDALYL